MKNPTLKPRMIHKKKMAHERIKKVYDPKLKMKKITRKPRFFRKEEMFRGRFKREYQDIKRLGSGGFGSVFLISSWKNGKEYVVKFTKKRRIRHWESGPQGQRWPREACMMHRLRQVKGMVVLKDVQYNKNFCQMVMEKQSGDYNRDLHHLIENEPRKTRKSGGLPEPHAAYIFRQLVELVSCLYYEHHMIHRDIKPGNILVNDRNEVQLIDFGSACLLNEDQIPFHGTRCFSSPEVLNRKRKFSPMKVEVWGLACTLFYCLFGKRPFESEEAVLTRQVILPKRVSNELASLLAHMFQKNPTNRASFREVINSPWLRKYTSFPSAS